MTLNWEDEYSVKIKGVDQQHQRLFSFINVVETSIKIEGGSASQEVVDQILNDEDHKKLFKMVDKVAEVTKTEGPGLRGNLSNVIKEMTEYAIYHFDTEEDLFKKYDYPELQEHIDAHNKYKEEIGKLVVELAKVDEDGLIDFAYKLLDFVQDWWIGHILHVDMKYSEFFNEHGIT